MSTCHLRGLRGAARTRAPYGFTLLELLVTVAVTAIVVTTAVPSFRAVVQNNQAAALSNDLVGALLFARSEAVRRGRAVSVCASADQQQCAAGPGATEWAAGWIVFTDEGTHGKLDGDDQLLRAWQAPDGRPSVAAERPFIRYLGSGLAESGLSFSAKLPGAPCHSERTIRVTRGGRPHVERGGCA